MKCQILSIVKTPIPPKNSAKISFFSIFFIFKSAKNIKVLIGINVVTKTPPSDAVPYLVPKKKYFIYAINTKDVAITSKKVLKSILNDFFRKIIIGNIVIAVIENLISTSSY